MPRIIDENGSRDVSDEAYNAYISEKTSAWSKSMHLSLINQLHDALFESHMASKNYVSMSELSLWAQSTDGEYYDEANALLAWYTNTCYLIEQYANAVTKETAVDPADFILTLPEFQFP